MTRKQAIVIAKRNASKSTQGYEYLQGVDHPNWMPHEWVIQAILEASKPSARYTRTKGQKND